MTETDPLKSLPITDGPSDSVPVFDCQVILTAPDGTGKLTGRVANLAGITTTGNTERDVLMAIVKEFKAVVQQAHKDGQPLPFREEPEKPGPGEVMRWVPVHL